VETHRLDVKDLPSESTATAEECVAWFKEMTVMRRTEIAADGLYKSKFIRGFCHLYDGQEAIASGMNTSFTTEDAIIGAYRIHCHALIRGFTPYQVLAEMMQKKTGAHGGKGGSMHYYNSS